MEARGLRKVYQPSGFTAVDGAGKSSTMRMIGCVSPFSGGSLRVLGLDAGSRQARTTRQTHRRKPGGKLPR